MLTHKDIVFPEVDISGDEGEPGWENGEWQDTGRHTSRHVRQPGTYAVIWQIIRDEWEETVRNYEANPDNVYEAWYYLDEHPMFWYFLEGEFDGLPAAHVTRLVHSAAFAQGLIEIDPHRVDENGTQQDEPELNSRLEWWYETGKTNLHRAYYHGYPGPHPETWHDIELDDRAPDYEQAVTALARAVHDRYGNDRRICDDEEGTDGTQGQDQSGRAATTGQC